MNEISLNAKMTKEGRITSIDLIQIINEFRKAEGKKAELSHADLMKKIKKEVETLQSLGLRGQGNFSSAKYLDKQGKERPCILLNRDGMLTILNSESAFVRYKTVEYINELETKTKQDSYMIENPIERAKRWIEEQEEKQQLQIQNEQQQKQLIEQKPLVEFANTVASTSDTIDISEFAKLIKDEGIKLGRNKLFEWLRNNKYIMKNNVPYQRYIDLKIFEIVEYTYNTPYGIKNGLKTLVTGKGQIYLIEKLKEGDKDV